eukprot:9473941-Pyramimonas_sp.AAC.1
MGPHDEEVSGDLPGLAARLACVRSGPRGCLKRCDCIPKGACLRRCLRLSQAGYLFGSRAQATSSPPGCLRGEAARRTATTTTRVTTRSEGKNDERRRARGKGARGGGGEARGNESGSGKGKCRIRAIG